jgi:threonine dehydratase
MRASRPPPRLARLRSLARFRSTAVGSAPLKVKTHVDKTPLEADTNPGFGANVRGLGHNNYLGKILNARVYDLARETPLQHAANLSAQLQNRVLLKREDMQPVFSFKIRGAYNKIAQLSREQLAAGIVACSAGNHAQGVALSAVHLGIDAVIIMPTATPAIKVNAVRKLGGNVVLHGSNYDEAAAEAMRRVAQEGRTLIHPFDDPLVIAGQGTIAMEILKQTTGKPLHAIFVCCGGGGMLAGIAAYVKRVRPGVLVIGVEAEDAAGMTASIKAGKLTTLDQVGIFADGAAVRTVGTETFRICNELVDDMVTVSNDEICAAIKDGFMDTRSILEPAGALAIAGTKKWVAQSNVKDNTYVALASGANMDFDRLRFVSERADLSETLVSVEIPERPGAFRAMMNIVEPRNVTEFSYRYCDRKTAASVMMSFQAKGPGDAQSVINALAADGCATRDLSGNELAKAHARHLVGGRSKTGEVENELLYRFEFPERPGALSQFLDTLNHGWNVSLFHYRNHGADIGRVLVGVQVPPDEVPQHRAFLDRLGYVYHPETENPVYQQFMR